MENAFPARAITGWQSRDDYPNWEEMQEYGVTLSDSECEALELAEVPVFGEKLLGWPAWVQGIEYPHCAVCGARMHLLFQIDSEGNIPYMFGDAGCGHITQCPNHPESLSFGWACS